MKLLHLIGFHDILNSQEAGDYKLEYQSAFDLMITRYNQYKCLTCSRFFWMPPQSFNERVVDEKIFKMTIETAQLLARRGDVDKAIKLLE